MTAQKGYTYWHWEQMINYIPIITNYIHSVFGLVNPPETGYPGVSNVSLPPSLVVVVVVSVRHICSAPVYRDWWCCQRRCPCPHLADEPASSLSFNAASVSSSSPPVSGYACVCVCFTSCFISGCFLLISYVYFYWRWFLFLRRMWYFIRL